MKKTFLFISLVLFITFYVSVLLADPMEEIDDWAAKQTGIFDANDVVTFMNGRDEGDITYGSEYVFNSAPTGKISVAVLDATHFVVSYQDDGNSDYGTAIVGEIEGTFTADFSATPTFGYYPSVEVNFTDLSGGFPTNWFWDFQNDGVYDSFEQNPTFTYTDVGIYDVKLKVSDDTNVDSLIQHNYITVELVPPAVPTNVQIEISGNDVVLTWAEVDTTIFGDPIYVDYYIIENSDDPYNDFIPLGATPDTMYIHYFITPLSDRIFYQIKSFVGSRQELDEYIERYGKKPEENHLLER